MPIKLEIVTVERLVYSGDVDLVSAPGVMGRLGILPKHTSLLTALEAGELRFTKGGKEEIFAAGWPPIARYNLDYYDGIGEVSSNPSLE